LRKKKTPDAAKNERHAEKTLPLPHAKNPSKKQKTAGRTNNNHNHLTRAGCNRRCGSTKKIRADNTNGNRKTIRPLPELSLFTFFPSVEIKYFHSEKSLSS
jgi:hypothetical protein